ncbi:DUF916 domain-containing protein [Ornithinibacillus halotolerans]|uniref:Cell surface protein n=1 Tax=Ornithinibacillus halotolerans TaxID=1274357 RepID=A0A916SEQ7_9BACI|nr:DUF916 domain-containing protein [Ornithinibacillus halotolerans]GGA92901.1 cell surface protein [Ornithinibacillus halotolerans]
MYRYRNVILAFLLSFGFYFSLGIQQVFSEETGPPLSIEPIYPENQETNTKGYFRLNVEPNQKQTIKVRITNNLDDDQRVTINKANGFTNPVGGMLYRETVDSPDSVLLDDAIKLVSYMTVDSEVIIKGKETVEVPVDITVPNIDSGTILGAIRFVTEGETDNESVEGEGGSANFVLKSETVHSIAIQLDLPNSITPDFSLGEAGFTLKGPSAYIEMKNDAQMIQEDISGEYRLEDSNGNELFQGEIPSFKMAPKTQIQYPFQWNYQTLEDGDYKLFVTADVNGNEVVAEEIFSIGNDEVEEYVERNQPVIPQGKTDNSNTNWLWMIVGAIILAGFMFWLGRRKK